MAATWKTVLVQPMWSREVMEGLSGGCRGRGVQECVYMKEAWWFMWRVCGCQDGMGGVEYQAGVHGRRGRLRRCRHL